MAHRAHDYDGIPLLSGPIPGLLDASQSSRLLRTPTCNLFFAAFDPHVARVEPALSLSGLDIDPGRSSRRASADAFASTNGKRIVIETDPENGTCAWRFVPRAKTEGEVFGDEGPWPRIVEFNGRLVRMTQDQWDIHKLDPEYECIMHASPRFATITRISLFDTDSTPVHDIPSTPPMMQSSLDNTPTPAIKRAISPTDQTAETPRKKQRTPSGVSDRMVVDGESFYAPTTPVPKAPTKSGENSKKRRRTSERLGSTSTSDAGPSKPKQSDRHTKAPVFADLSLNDQSADRGAPPTTAKRVRSRSPGTIRREMEQKRVAREKRRKADRDARAKARRNARRDAFWEGVGIPYLDNEEGVEHMSKLGSSEAGANGDVVDGADNSSSRFDDSDNLSRLAAIEESRRKLAELEKDKELWEQSARRRRQVEAEEELSRERAKAMREEEQRLKECMAAVKKQREEQWGRERWEREREARIRELSGRMVVTQPRDSLRWNTRLALERYIRTSADFDGTKFTSGERSMSFAQVPWPVLHSSFSVQDVDWDTVEAFFEEVQRFLTPAKFKELVKKSHRRFHPDRWRSRGLLMSVQDDTERDLLEVAGSTVAQALTPLWKEVTGR